MTDERDLADEAAGETDLESMLLGMHVSRRPGTFTFVSVHSVDGRLADAAQALVREAEGTSLVLSTEDARSAGLPVGFEAAWLTLEVHSALAAVGLTAEVSTRLARVGIACNVLAGAFHDHLLVPVDRADEAIVLLTDVTGDDEGVGVSSR